MGSVLEYLERAAWESPERTALADQDRTFTYGEAYRLSRQVGAFVARLEGGCRPVGVWARHDAVTPLLCWGAAWGGCFYVPLDPDLPPGKLRKILDDCALDLILTASPKDALPPGTDFSGRVICLEEAVDEGRGEDCPPAGREDDVPLYMVYTSGSTGTPKGVLKSHGAVRHFIEDFAAAFPFSPAEVIGSQTPFFFDASAKDLYLTLYLGARLEVVDAGLFYAPVQLVEYLNRRRVTTICWVPSALSILTQLNTFSEIKPQYLRNVFFVGEVFPMKQLNRWRAALPQVRYVNLYGSTELAGVCCWYEVEGDFADTDRLPIGRPLGRSQVFLRAEGEIVTRPGVMGEICVASPALALCYYNDPEKTRSVFRREVLPSGEEARVLYTGDLAQYTPEGLLEFAARKDHQFKHMGRRIEAGEIEAAAAALDQVARCCCLYDGQRGKIVLFCQLASGCEATGRELRRALRDRLADYMVPNKVTILPQLPLNPNGKIDRPALRASLE